MNSEDVRLEFYRSVRSELGVVIPSNDFGIFFSRFFDKADRGTCWTRFRSPCDFILVLDDHRRADRKTPADPLPHDRGASASASAMTR